jgi:hypothetical protein
MPPTDTHSENSTPSIETWPEEYGEIKYEISLRTTVDPEDDREIALTKAGGNTRQCKESIKTRQLSNKNEGILFPLVIVTHCKKDCLQGTKGSTYAASACHCCHVPDVNKALGTLINSCRSA